ncbi:MAG: lipoyl(octanoyl) transferase LipB [Aaplasma endosymbiont of Hyalomma asiaticum]
MCVEWKVSREPLEYDVALEAMLSRVDKIISNQKSELVWLLEHNPVYTAGTSAKPEELLVCDRFPVVKTTRGGKYSYHGPGQRVIYVMLDLKKRESCDVRLYVRNLGQWIINTLNEFSIDSYFSGDNVGVWVRYGEQSKKIAAFGIRLRRWVTYHGVAVNICPDLSHYSGIVPCGIADFGVTSTKALGKNISFEQFDEVLEREFYKVFSA